jgi:L-glyceraldehyde 3-phosphate reductase
MPRDELIVSSKAGYRMWPGPYGEWGSRKYIVASCDQSLARTGLEYFDIFYSHRPDPQTPLEETLGALDHLVRQGKALYVGVSTYTGPQLEAALAVVARERLAPITIHQPYYNMLDRWIEPDLLPRAAAAGVGVIAFGPLASGLLSGRYSDGEVPTDGRAARDWAAEWVAGKSRDEKRRILGGLAALARERGQTLPQMGVAWVLRHAGMTSTVFGASRPEQVAENVAALSKLEFSGDELAHIDALTA